MTADEKIIEAVALAIKRAQLGERAELSKEVPWRIFEISSAHAAIAAYQAEAWQGSLGLALRQLLDHVDRQTCVHEETRRGGFIWTICDQCGKKWADDEGGFVPYSDPPAVARARLVCEALPPSPSTDRSEP